MGTGDRRPLREAARGEADPTSYLPLPTATFHILLALKEGERHGYAIIGDVERLSEGTVRLGPGTLYGAIKRLVADGLIEESEERPDPDLDDKRRRYYRLTAAGGRVCAAELRRLDSLLARVRGTPRPAHGAGGA